MKVMGLGTGGMSIVFIIILFALLAIIPARIAKQKGYDYWTYYAFGLVFFLPALVVIMIKPDKNESKLGTADEIEKYKNLLDSGTITQDEFDIKKRELLGL